jgi:hypothetical protein
VLGYPGAISAVPDTLDYAPPDREAISRRRFGWIACVITVLLALGKGYESVRIAFDFQNRSGMTGPQLEGLYVGRALDPIKATIVFGLAAVGCIICWRRKTVGWLSIAALLVGIACWIGATLTLP